jgi:hypothetical protein
MAISLAEEQRRMKRHPGIVFRDGATGRRPALADGPQVWVLARLFCEDRLDRADARERVTREVSELMELTLGQVQAAVSYYLAYQDEIDDWIRDLDEYSRQAKAEWLREQELLRA